jgi:Mg2+ and Co2+ transporter CorA
MKLKKLWPDVYDQDYIDKQNEEEKFKYGTSINKRTKAKSKTLRSPMLELIKDELHQISITIETNHTFKDSYGDKVIFIKFKGQVNEPRSWSGGGMGLTNVINFQYFVGFRFIDFGKKHHLDEKEQRLEKYSSQYKMGKFEGGHDGREHTIVSLHQTDNDKEKLKSEFVIVPWTEEREEYLKTIQDNFTTMTDRLNEFLKDLTEEKLDHLIVNQPIQKLLN